MGNAGSPDVLVTSHVIGAAHQLENTEKYMRDTLRFRSHIVQLHTTTPYLRRLLQRFKSGVQYTGLEPRRCTNYNIPFPKKKTVKEDLVHIVSRQYVLSVSWKLAGCLQSSVPSLLRPIFSHPAQAVLGWMLHDGLAPAPFINADGARDSLAATRRTVLNIRTGCHISRNRAYPMISIN